MGSVCKGKTWKRKKRSLVQLLICNVRKTELAPWHILRTLQKENESLKEQRPVWYVHSIETATIISNAIAFLG